MESVAWGALHRQVTARGGDVRSQAPRHEHAVVSALRY
jgi:hypothetical protein